MDIRAIREQFGRVKAYYLRNETLRALNAALMGLKGVVASGVAPSTEIRGHIREAIQLLARDEQIKKLLKAPLMYQPGQERQLFAVLAGVYKVYLEEMNREDHDAALGRKQKLDQAYNLGVKLLAQGDASGADGAFNEAISHYRDEDTLFTLIGKALVEANEVRRAVPYLQRGLELNPDDAELKKLMEVAGRGRNDGTFVGK